MGAGSILKIFIVLKVLQYLAERGLGQLNRRYYLDAQRRGEAQKVLGITDDDMAKTLAYSEDKFRFGTIASWVSLMVMLIFLTFGGLGLFESWAKALASSLGGESIVTGLIFFGLLGLAAMLLNLPFEAYRTFVLEEKHGFNRQTVRGFIGDRIKGILIGAVLGGLILSAILWIMERAGQYWWLYAWIAMSVFSLLTAWLYPTFLAPLFNKFRPLEEGELKTKIEELAGKIGFETSGIHVMDASKRSSHGNAYFTGILGKKRIVLFDTLLDSMSANEVVAVLAHELGHFKLKHIFWQLIRGIAMTGLTFYLLSLVLPLDVFYQAFHLEGLSNYGALIVFTMWFGILDFIMQPFENYLSRSNEFAADKFARTHGIGADPLASALLKLREKSHSMPLSHPWFSAFYHSHPPIFERLKVLRAGL